MDSLPPCGFYRTTAPIGSIPVGRLVYFHNHGTPGAGVYLPQGWQNNVASFAANGTTLTDATLARTLHPLPAQGLYRVAESFHCCEKKCRLFEADLLVQLGYNGNAQPIVFVPEFSDSGMGFPTSGSPVDESVLDRLQPLKVQRRADPQVNVKDSTAIH